MYVSVWGYCATIILVLKCPALNASSNGQITCLLGIDNLPTSGDTFSLRCYPHYSLRTCEASELSRRWTGSNTLCSRSK